MRVLLVLGLLASACLATQMLRPGQGPFKNVLLNSISESSSFVEAQKAKQAPAKSAPAKTGQTVSTPEKLTDQSSEVFMIDEQGKLQNLGRSSSADVQERMHQLLVESLLKLEQSVDITMASHSTQEQPEAAPVVEATTNVVEQPSAAPLSVVHDETMEQSAVVEAPVEPQSETQSDDVNGPSSIVVDTQQETLAKYVSSVREVKFLTTFENVKPVFAMVSSAAVEVEQLEKQDCIYLFSQCHFKGVHMKTCSNNRQPLNLFEHNIGSIYVPEGGFLTYDYGSEQGLQRTFVQSVQCLQHPLNILIDQASVSHKFKDGALEDD